MYETESVLADCKEKNLPNETAGNGYAYRKTTILKSTLRNSIPGVDKVFPTHILNNGCQLFELYPKFGFHK
jgi:hypothetical protein